MRHALVFSAFLTAIVVIQFAVGAYDGERGNYSDEAAHFMNGLLVRDYLSQGLLQNPLHFAERYYLDYPKIAPGMWPPLFHVALGVVMLVWPSPHAAALGLLAFATAWTAWRLYRILERIGAGGTAWLAVGLFVLTPAIADLTSAVMLDIVVAAFALEATYWLAVFFSSEDWRHAALFGLFAALGCLTKGNGLAIVLVPVLLMCLTGRFELLRARGLHVAALIVAILAIPPLAISYRLDAVIGDFGPVSGADLVRRAVFYSTYILRQLGALTVIGAVLGFASRMPSNRSSDRLALHLAESLKALALAALIFHLGNPHRAHAGRYLAMMIAPLLGLLVLGVGRLGALVRPIEWRRAFQTAVLAAVVINFFVVKPAMASRRPLGYRDAAAFLEDRGGLAGRRTFIVSDENGEGAFVSEVAGHQPAPAATVIRASKLIAMDDWGGHNFSMRFPSSGAVMRELEDLHVDYVIVDRSPQARAMPYYGQVSELIASNPTRFGAIQAINGARELVVYALKYRSPGPRKKLQVDLTYSLGRVLGQ